MKKDIITMKLCWYYNQCILLLFLLFTVTNLPITIILIYLFIYIITAYLIYLSILSLLLCGLLIYYFPFIILWDTECKLGKHKMCKRLPGYGIQEVFCMTHVPLTCILICVLSPEGNICLGVTFLSL